MSSDEFIKYIRSLNIKWNEKEVDRLNYFINAVKEIESINLEMNGNLGISYFKEFMLPEDFIRILRDLRGVRISKFCKILSEKKKYLNKLELSKEEYKKIYNDFERELASKLKLKIYKNARENKTIIK